MRTGLKDQTMKLIPVNDGTSFLPGGLMKITNGEETHEVECGFHVQNLEIGNIACIIREGKPPVILAAVHVVTKYMLVEIDGSFFLIEYEFFNRELSNSLEQDLESVEAA